MGKAHASKRMVFVPQAVMSPHRRVRLLPVGVHVLNELLVSHQAPVLCTKGRELTPNVNTNIPYICTWISVHSP